MEELAELEEVSRSLGVEAWRVKGALRRGTIQHLRGEEPPSLIFRKDMGPIERGTAVFLGDGVVVIRGFPKIKRAFYLRSALRRHFQGARVAVEEKMNGYNVRLFRLQDRVFA
ncbi:MAG: RNA ligase, partial [Euryarchaeota archaeon]|nr:RNA ligase [Euryarchaeota archaeon]